MKSNQIKFAFVTCYLGNLPWYFNLFLKSCETNSDVDFIFVSDQKFNGTLPDNFQWIYMEKNQVETLISSKLSLDISLKYAYKLCDLKPAYGIVFDEYLKGYDFWGHCDIDLIFGRIRYFITDDILNTNDVICVTKDYVTGFFTLFRNTPYVNRLYEHSRDYKRVFESEKHYCFDECNNLFAYLLKGKNIFDLPTEVESMTHVVKKLHNEGKIKAYFDQFVVESRPGKMFWNNGQLIIKDKYEILLYHLIEFKRLKHYFCPFKNNVPDEYYIEKFYFLKQSPKSTIGKLYKYYYHILLKAKLRGRSIRNLLIASSKIKEKEFEKPERFSGKYGKLAPTKDFTEIHYMNNRFFIKFPRNTMLLPLKHIRNNFFYCTKYNIEYEFGYSQETQTLFILGRSLFNENQSKDFKKIMI